MVRVFAGLSSDANANAHDCRLISAIAVTVPSCYFLWPEASHADAHGAHGAHDEHAEEHEEEHEEASEEPKEEAEDSKEDEAPKEEASDDESKADDKNPEQPEEEKQSEPKGDSSKPDKTEPEEKSNQKVDGVQFKGKTAAGDDNNEMTDTRKREPDSKGAFKKRIDSGYGKNLGEGPSQNEDGKTNVCTLWNVASCDIVVTDISTQASTAKPISGDQGAIDTKQKGLSTTATRHSTAIHEDPEKSKKGEGVPETAKSMGTVDPNRPAAESSDRGSHQ